MRVPNPSKIIKYISQINHIYPEQLILHQITKTDCPTCVYNPLLKESTDPNCPTCGGKGVIEQDIIKVIQCSVEGIDEKDILLIPPGVAVNDLIRVTIDKQEIDLYSIDVTKVDYFTYQGTDYVLESYRPEYLNGIHYETNCILRKKI